MFAHLALQRRHQRTQPAFQLADGHRVDLLQVHHHRIEEALGQHRLVHRQQPHQTELALVRLGHLLDLGEIAARREAQRRPQIQSIVTREALVHGRHHLRDLAHQPVGLLEVQPHGRKQRIHAVLELRRQLAGHHHLARTLHVAAQAVPAQVREHRLRMAREHRAQGRQMTQALVEVGPLVADPLRHLLDHRLVLATQPVQLEGLLDLVAPAHRQQVQRHLRRLLELAPHLLADDHLLLRNHLFRQRMLQLLQPAATQQGLVAVDLGHQPLLGRDRIHPRRRQVEEIAHRHHLPGNLQIVLGLRTQLVPQAVDLVQHHETPGPVGLGNVALPDLDVAARHPRVGRQHEQHGVRIGNQVQRQLRLRPDGIQPRGVDDHQPQLQQRVRNVDDGVPPGRNLHLPRRDRAPYRLGIVVQPQLARLLGGHQQRLAHRIEGLAQRGHIGHVHRDEAPVVVLRTQIGQRHRQQPRVDGQQPHAHRQPRVVLQLGRTHRGPARRRRNHPLAVLREEDRIDQLRLATGELGHECHLQQGVVQPFDDLRKLEIQAGISRVRLRQPVTVAFDGRFQIGTPPAIRFDLLTDAFFRHAGSVHKLAAPAGSFTPPASNRVALPDQWLAPRWHFGQKNVLLPCCFSTRMGVAQTGHGCPARP